MARSKELTAALELYYNAFYEYVDCGDTFGYTDKATFEAFKIASAYENVLKVCFGLTEAEIDKIDDLIRKELRGD